MPLTPAQLPTFKTDILANTNTIPAGMANAGAFVGQQIKDIPNNGDGNLCVATWYNLLASPDFYNWYFTRSRMDNRRAILTTAGAGNQLDALTGSKRDSLLWCLDDTLQPTLSSVRTTVDDLCGSQNVLKAAILDSFKRKATNAEKLFATGTGSFAVPATGAFEMSVTASDVNSALNLP